MGLPDVPDAARHRSRPPVVTAAGDVVGELVVSLPGG
jgi:hypothetical protein